MSDTPKRRFKFMLTLEAEIDQHPDAKTFPWIDALRAWALVTATLNRGWTANTQLVGYQELPHECGACHQAIAPENGRWTQVEHTSAEHDVYDIKRGGYMSNDEWQYFGHLARTGELLDFPKEKKACG